MIFYVEDMSCSHCKAALEKSISTAGAVDFQVDVRSKTIQVRDRISRESIEKAIRDAGYTPQIVNE